MASVAPQPTPREVADATLLELTAVPTAAGREQRVIEWVRRWTRSRRNLRLAEDRAGNLIITHRARGAAAARGAARSRKRATGATVRPLYITAHLDHPAFVVTDAAREEITLDFRGGVHAPYFENAPIEIIDARDVSHRATVTSLDPDAKPFKVVTARLTSPGAARGSIKAGDIGRWRFDGQTVPRIEKGLLHTHACDDLAAVAAALSALDLIRVRKGLEHVGVLLTRAEEVGFIGAIAACKAKSIPKSARVICLENSRSFAESPIGGGPIVRVGDKLSVFGPALTNRIAMLMMEHEKQHPGFKWQRKLMPGGTCEATTFTAYGYESTCLCLPLGNYHNMIDIDGVLEGARPARMGPEFISVDDYHGLIEMLLVCAEQLDSVLVSSLRDRMDRLLSEYGQVLKE